MTSRIMVRMFTLILASLFLILIFGGPTTSVSAAEADVYKNGNISFLSAISSKNPYITITNYTIGTVVTPEKEFNLKKSDMILTLTIDPDKPEAQELPSVALTDILDDIDKYYYYHPLITFVTYLLFPYYLGGYNNGIQSYVVKEKVQGDFYLTERAQDIPFIVKLELAEKDEKSKPFVTMYAYVDGELSGSTETTPPVTEVATTTTTQTIPVTTMTTSKQMPSATTATTTAATPPVTQMTTTAETSPVTEEATTITQTTPVTTMISSKQTPSVTIATTTAATPSVTQMTTTAETSPVTEEATTTTQTTPVTTMTTSKQMPSVTTATTTAATPPVTQMTTTAETSPVTEEATTTTQTTPVTTMISSKQTPSVTIATTTAATPPPTVPAGADVYKNGNISFINVISPENPYVRVTNSTYAIIVTPEEEFSLKKSDMILTLTIDPDKPEAQELPSVAFTDIQDDITKHYSYHPLITFVTYLIFPYNIDLYNNGIYSYVVIKNIMGDFYLTKRAQDIPFIVKLELAEKDEKSKPFVTMYAYVDGELSESTETPTVTEVATTTTTQTTPVTTMISSKPTPSVTTATTIAATPPPTVSTSPSTTTTTTTTTITTTASTVPIEEFTFSETPATIGPAPGVQAENCIWEPLKTNYQYLNVITNATWFEWYLNNCFPMHIDELLGFQDISDNQWTEEAVPIKAPEIEQGCYFLKYYMSGDYIKVVTNATWFWWYINNCFPMYQGVLLPFNDAGPTTETAPSVEATTPSTCILEQYFPDGNYLKVVTNTTWFDWYMSHCYPKYIGEILPLIPFVDYQFGASTSTTYSPPYVATSTVPNTEVQYEFCSLLSKYVRTQSFSTLTGGSWYTWYLYNCPETDYKCC